MRLQPENTDKTAHAGLYIHMPFCLRKCPYCGFYSTEDLHEMGSFVDALTKEMDLLRPPVEAFDTIYIGGGTPSLLKPGHVMRVLEHAHKRFVFAQDVEVTMEINPGTVSVHSLKAFLRCGVNRVSLGIQSFDDRGLRFLGRVHSACEAREAIRFAREAGVENLGFDLMYGLPDQSLKQWLKDLTEAITYEPEHMSCYMLTYEQGTPFDQWRKAGRFRPLDEQAVGDLFEVTVDFLNEGGYEQYEISNFARGKDLRSGHNQKYWCHAPYIGLGPSAHSFIEPTRWWNHRSLEDYLRALRHGALAVMGAEDLNQGQLMLESICLGLRTSDGISIRYFDRRYDVNFLRDFAPVVEKLQAEGMLTVRSDTCALTREGMMFADAISGMFAELLQL